MDNTAPTTEDDLIDFQLGSPEPPQTCSSPLLSEDNVSEHLLDFELPVLEETLQASAIITSPPSQTRQNSNSRGIDQVDIDEVLISIDDDLVDRMKQRIKDNEDEESIAALGVLMQLDEMLNDELNASDKYLNSHSEDDDNDDDNCNYTIEDCLYELDNYLKEFDTSGSEDFMLEQTGENGEESIEQTDLGGRCESVGCDQGNPGMIDYRYGNISDKLLQLASRTTAMDSGGGCTNRAFVNSENLNIVRDAFVRRSLSGCSGGERLVARQHPYRATIGGGGHRNRDVASLAGPVRYHLRRASLGGSHQRDRFPQPTVEVQQQLPTRVRRISGAAADSDEEIDWSWVQDVARDVRAHDCLSETTTEEDQQNSLTATTSEDVPTAEDTVMAANVTKDAPSTANSRRASSSWLRTSMRRVRHFRLPSDTTSSTLDVAASSNQVDSVPSVEVPQVSMPPQAVRPVSAPSRLAENQQQGSASVVSSSSARSRSRDRTVSRVPGGRARSSSASSRSRRPRSLSSSESSLASSVDSTPVCTFRPNPPGSTAEQPATNNTRRTCDRPRETEIPPAQSPLGQWPHGQSSMFACLGCTLGLFNISRFALLSVHFGANFMLQFLFLSLVFGMPLFTLQLCLGQQLGAGIIDMWRISPLFQGVGVALLVAQALTGLYSIIGVSWMFIYFRDSFVTKTDKYRWAEPFEYYRDDMRPIVNGSYKLSETVPDYLSGVVLQRHNLASGNHFGTIKFQVAFNLAVVWMIVFVSLSKGLRSYGKVVYVFTLLPIFGTFILCAKMLGMMPADSINVIFPETSWSEFFLNTQSWISACQETFLTWGLLGAAAMQIASHNKHNHLLQRDSRVVSVITLIILLLVAFLANTCIEILKHNGYSYVPDSFERISTYVFLRPAKEPLPPSLAATPFRFMTHTSLILGERVTRPGVDPSSESGYQVLRLATEIVPTTLAILGADQVSPFWAVLFYFVLILFGIAQQLAIWHCVITGIMAIRAKVLKSWETTITFFSCAAGFVLGLPMTTEMGIYVVYFLDYTIGGVWWLVLVILLQVIAVFMVRGRPYSGDTVVTALFPTNVNRRCWFSWAPHMLSFIWNVILPVVLMVLCVVFFKNGNFRELFIWHHAPSADYWPLWVRQIGSLLQLMPILCVPLVAIIQSYRYLNNGQNDIFERIQLLYRPPMNSEHMDDLTIHQAATAANLNNNTTSSNIQAEDPPPKYTPPPSYTTATGARIAKLFRQSFRRSVRRIAHALGESSSTRQRTTVSQINQPPPPDYSAVLVEMGHPQMTAIPHIAINVTTLADSVIHDTQDAPNRMSTLERRASRGTLTAADVASILRSSFRRSTIRAAANSLRRSAQSEETGGSLSAECLVDGAAPIGETSLVLGDLSCNEIKIISSVDN